MSINSITRSIRPSAISTPSSEWMCAACRRYQSSFRRTRKALKIKQDESFLPSKTAPTDHIIFNPPSSAPSVYHTPTIFLPPDDPRRKIEKMNISQRFGNTSGPGTGTLPKVTSALTLPRLRPERPKKYHLTLDDVAEIRRLRQEDPRKWSRNALATKFNCSSYFIALCQESPMMRAERYATLDAIRETWGRKKREAREDRLYRKSLWGREL